MNVLHCSSAVTSSDLGIIIGVFLHPAEPAHLLQIFLWHFFHYLGLLKLFVLSVLIDVKELRFSSEFADFKLDSSDLDNVIAFDHMAIRSERSNHQP